MVADYYPLSDVLAIASVHPFYSDAQYPPTREELPGVLENIKSSSAPIELEAFPLLGKKDLYKHIARLTVDEDPHNGYRRDTYISVTGGGSGTGPAMAFATDSNETRRQRAVFGRFLHQCGILGPGDWVLTMHVSGKLYRALDLMTELFESAGATVLCASDNMQLEHIVTALIQYRVNTISGDAGQLVQLARFIASLPEEKQDDLRVTKALYTSETMTPAQRTFLKSVFPGLAISSVIGSAEAGPWGASTAEMTESAIDENYADFLFDDRLMHLEVFSLDAGELDRQNDQQAMVPVANGEKGLLVQTSLQRLRNPLVRYVCGDVASFHPLPDSTKKNLTSDDAEHYHVVRVYGRDRRMSFDWYGEYFEFSQVQALLRTASWGVLQYQIIRRHRDDDAKQIETVLEVRILRDAQNSHISEQEIRDAVEKFFVVFDSNRELFELKFVTTYSEFIRSTTGRKVINYIDRTTSSN